MLKLRNRLTAALLLTSGAAFAQAQTAAPTAPRQDSQRAATAPGVTRAVEHPDTSADQTQPDASQPETAVDDQKLAPETATDAAKKSAESKKAAELAKQGVRSNTPPSSTPPASSKTPPPSSNTPPPAKPEG